MTANDALLPCPFCGSAAEYYPDSEEEGEGWSVMCSGGAWPPLNGQSDECPLSTFAFQSRQAATNAWNRRAADALATERAARETAERNAARLDSALDEVLRERDNAQDALLRTSEAMDGPEWCGKLPPEPPPNSGDLHLDVPVLAAEWRKRAETAERERDDWKRWYDHQVTVKVANVERAETAEREREAMRAALGELVACKELKDAIDAEWRRGFAPDDLKQWTNEEWDERSSEYERRKPLAWAAARALAGTP